MASNTPASLSVSPEAKSKRFPRTLFEKARNVHIFKRKPSEQAQWPRPPTPFPFANHGSSSEESSIDSELSLLSTLPVVNTGWTSTQTTPPKSATPPPLGTSDDAKQQQDEMTPDRPTEFYNVMTRTQNTPRLLRTWQEVELHRLSVRLGERFNFNHDFHFDIDNDGQDEIPGFNSMVRAALEEPDTIFEASSLRLPCTSIAEADDDDAVLAVGGLCVPPLGHGEYKRQVAGASDVMPMVGGSRYPPGIEDILKTPELGQLFQAAAADTQGSKFREDMSSFRTARDGTGIEFDQSIFGRPASEVIRPPYSPRSVSPLHQQPGNWDLRGARAAVAQWLHFCTKFPAQYKEGLMNYFTKWFIPRSSKKYLGAVKKLSSHLELLQKDLNQVEHLGPDQAKMMETIDMAVRACKEDSDGAYNAAVQKGVSCQGLLCGKELAWRKHRIANQPRLDRATKTLKAIKADVKELRKTLEKGCSAG